MGERTEATQEALLQKWEDAQRKVYDVELALYRARRERRTVLSECARAGFVPPWNEKYLRSVS